MGGVGGGGGGRKKKKGRGKPPRGRSRRASLMWVDNSEDDDYGDEVGEDGEGPASIIEEGSEEGDFEEGVPACLQVFRNVIHDEGLLKLALGQMKREEERLRMHFEVERRRGLALTDLTSVQLLTDVTHLEIAQRERDLTTSPAPGHAKGGGSAVQKVHQTAMAVLRVLEGLQSEPSSRGEDTGDDDGSADVHPTAGYNVDGSSAMTSPGGRGGDKGGSVPGSSMPLDATVTTAMRDIAARLKRQAERERSAAERGVADSMAEQQAQLLVLSGEVNKKDREIEILRLDNLRLMAARDSALEQVCGGGISGLLT